MITQEQADAIKAAYESALDNQCTCYSNADGSCQFCNQWRRAEKLVDSVTEKPTITKQIT